MVLQDPVQFGVPTLQGLPPLPLPRHPNVLLPIGESGEPLKRFPAHVLQLAYYHQAGWPGSQPVLLARASVVQKIATAARSLPKRFGLVVLDAWRTRTLQSALFDHYFGHGLLEPGYVSDPANQLWSPPHEAGAAVDLSLTWDGNPLALGTDFDSFTSDAHLAAFETRRSAEPVRSLRRLLAKVLTDVGMCGYPEEWWHFSYGDQHWAFNRGASAAIYGPTDATTGPVFAV